MKKQLIPALALLSITPFMAACGGSDDSASTSSSPELNWEVFGGVLEAESFEDFPAECAAAAYLSGSVIVEKVDEASLKAAAEALDGKFDGASLLGDKIVGSIDSDGFIGFERATELEQDAEFADAIKAMTSWVETTCEGLEL